MQAIHIERTRLDTGSTFPSIVRCLQVQLTETSILSPVEVAVDVLRRKNTELQCLIHRYTDMLSQQVQHSINPLTMALKGVVDPAVMGGIVKYEEVSSNLLQTIAGNLDPLTFKYTLGDI